MITDAAITGAITGDAAGGIANEAAGEAARDPLTGLPGFVAARARLTAWLTPRPDARPASGHEAGVHALLLGFRRLESINLAYGEATGDGALIEVAARLSQGAAAELDDAWLVARGSGGTFLVISRQPCSRERWQMFAEALADRVARPIVRHSGTLRLSPRLALLRVLAGENAGSALDRLAQTLAAAKQQQGRRVVWASGEAVHPARTAAELESDLLRAIDADEIEIVFQPQFALAGGPARLDPLAGAEALARWNHPRLGRIGAGTLFAIAERLDHIAPLSRHIAARALAEAARWPASAGPKNVGPAPLRLALNITADDLAAASFADELGSLLDTTGFPRDRLTLEMTEQVLLADLDLAVASLKTLADTGIRIALDDFGAGFCNFLYLKLLPLAYLKLDRTMVAGLDGGAENRDLAVLRGLVAMARALGLAVIAEGIETEAQHAAIRAEGCALYQGFLRATPLSAAAFLALARASAEV